MTIRSRFTFTFYDAPRNVGRGQAQPVKHVGRLMGRGPARPINFSHDRPLPGPAHQFFTILGPVHATFKNLLPARPGPARTIGQRQALVYIHQL